MEASLSSHYQYHRMQSEREKRYSDNHQVSQFEAAAAAAAAASAAATASLFDQHLIAMASSSAMVDDGLYRTFPNVFDRLPYMEIARAMAATARSVTYDAHVKAPAFGLHQTEERHSKKSDQVAVALTSLPMPTGSRKYQRRSSVCAAAVPTSEHSGSSGNREKHYYDPKQQPTVDDVLASIRSGLAFTQDHLDAVLYGRRSGTFDEQEGISNGCQESMTTSSKNLFEHATISPSSPSVTKRTGSLSYGIDRLLQRNESNPSSQPQPPMTSSLTSRRLHRASLKNSPSTADLPEGLEIRRVWRGGNVHYGVYSIRSTIPRGTRFGPYRGRIVNPSEIKANDDNTFMWEVFVNGSLSHFVDGRGPAGSWMSYVNCARYPHEQNLVAVQTSKRVATHSSITKSPPTHKYFSSPQSSPVFTKRKACEKICHDNEFSDTAEPSVQQFEGMGLDCARGAEIYYETCQDIPFGAELLVWYGDCYEQFLGVPVALRSNGGNIPPVLNSAKTGSIQLPSSSPCLSPMLKAAEYPTQLALSPPHHKVSSSEDAVNVASGRSVRGDRSENDLSDGYQCSRCGKVFAYKYYRDKHLKYTRCVDQGDRKFPCHLCSRSFEKRDRLRIHVLHVHEKHRPHKCMLCSKSFSQSSSLNKHMRVHSGERPYKCVYCSKAFTASSILRTHIRQHSGEKPFKCKFCGKAFASHAAHDSHARRTHGTPPFAGASGDSTACGRCGRTFENSRELKIHDCKSPAPAAAAAAAADSIGFLGRFNKNSMKILDAFGSNFQRDSLQLSNEDEPIDVVGLETNDDVRA